MQVLAYFKAANKSEFRQQSLELLLILSTVSLFYLAFPTKGYSNLAWFALIPVCMALKNQDRRQAFVTGFLAATLGWFFSIWWVVPGLSSITASTQNLIVPFVLLYCCLSALPYALGCWLHVYLNCRESVVGALLSALNFTVLVNYTPQILPGNLAHGLYNKPMFIQAADIGGVPLVFFIIHSVCFLLANAITIDKTNSKQKVACLLLAIIVFCANYGYGYFKINQSDPANIATSKQIKVAMVQPNISIENRTRDDWQQLAPELMTMIRNITENEAVDLLILPELPVPVSFQYFDFDKDLLNKSLNDAWFGKTAGQSVHLALSTFRSVEYRKNLIRNTNNGISVIIDPYGRQIVSSKITPHTRGYSVTALNIVANNSFYQQFPYFIKWLFIIIMAFAVVVVRNRNIKNRQINA